MRQALAGAAALALAGCSSAPDTEAPPTTPASSPVAADAPIRANARPGGPSLLPSDIEDPATEQVARLIYRGLFAADAAGKLIPAVATTMTSDDGVRWLIETDPAATFADGSPITAQVLADSWAFTAARAAEKDVATPLARIRGYPGDGARLPGVRVVDERSLVITLAAPTPTYDALAGDLAFVPLPAAHRADPEAAAVRPVGNGPYALTAKWSGGSTYTLRPNSTYRGADQPQNTGIEFTTYPTIGEARAAFLAGELDVLDEMPPTPGRPASGATVANQPVGVTQSLDFPLTEPTWTGRRGLARRAAISRALDREAAAGAYNGARIPATGLAAPVVEGYSADVCGALCTHDPAGAAARWQPVAVASLDVAYAADGTDGVAARQVCADVEESLDIPCTTTAYPHTAALASAVRSGKVNGPYIRTWRMAQRSLGGFLMPRYASGAAQNWGEWTDRLAHAQLLAATSASRESATAAFQAAERFVLASLPSVPLWSVNATTASSPNVVGVVTDSSGIPVYGAITRPSS